MGAGGDGVRHDLRGNDKYQLLRTTYLGNAAFGRGANRRDGAISICAVRFVFVFGGYSWLQFHERGYVFGGNDFYRQGNRKNRSLVFNRQWIIDSVYRASNVLALDDLDRSALGDNVSRRYLGIGDNIQAV